MSIRTRLLLACAVAATLPVLLLAVLAGRRTSLRLEQTTAERLERAVNAVRSKLARESERAAGLLASVPTAALLSEGEPAARLAPPALDVFEVVAGDGRRLASRHCAAGVGLPDDDVVLSTHPPLRLETVAEGFGAARRLTVTAERAARAGGAAVTVRGGFVLDADFFGELSSLLGLELGCLAAESGAWFTAPGSPLRALDAPRFAAGAGQGRARLGGEPWQYSSLAVAPSLRLVAAAPRAPLEAEQAATRKLTLGAAAGALLLALLGAHLVAGQLTRPLRALADGVTGVAGGDLTRSVADRRSDELGELARTFNDMTGALRASEARLRQAERVAAWREMARRLAHELKNPLFPIQVSIETLARAFERQPESTSPELLALLRDSTRTLLREVRGLQSTVDGFASFAKSPPPAPRPTDVAALLEHVVGVQRPAAGPVRLELRAAPGLPPVRADPHQVTRALTNLVANAVSVSPPGGTVWLAARARDADVVIEIADEGPGLSPEEQARAFTPYHTTRPGGTGLGLAIVQGIASDHGGRVEVDSREGCGATFRLVLPVAGPHVESGRP